MPKQVDHDARREEIARALWRVVRRDGVRGASVRTVAAEAGWSPGAVRYYFPDQAGLLSFAMGLVSRRVTERVRAIRPEGTATAIALRYLEEVIPLDDERQAEFEVWLSFVAQARTESGGDGLDSLLGPVHESLLRLCTMLLDRLAETGALRGDVDIPLEAERLHALIDGLSLHAAIQPDRTSPKRVHNLLARHLSELLVEQDSHEG